MSYKSVRLLNDAIHGEMEKLRKQIMSIEDAAEPVGYTGGDTALEHLNELRKLFDELAAKADRPTVEDVVNSAPADYVATMKPLVRRYHQLLFSTDTLCACINEDLQANASVLLLVGDAKTVVKTAYDPNRPEVQLAVESLLATLDEGMKQIVGDGVTAYEQATGIEVPENPQLESVPQGEKEPT